VASSFILAVLLILAAGFIIHYAQENYPWQSWQLIRTMKQIPDGEKIDEINITYYLRTTFSVIIKPDQKNVDVDSLAYNLRQVLDEIYVKKKRSPPGHDVVNLVIGYSDITPPYDDIRTIFKASRRYDYITDTYIWSLGEVIL